MANPAMDVSGMGARRKDGLQGPNTKRASQGVPRGDGQWLEAMDWQLQTWVVCLCVWVVSQLLTMDSFFWISGIRVHVSFRSPKQESNEWNCIGALIYDRNKLVSLGRVLWTGYLFVSVGHFDGRASGIRLSDHTWKSTARSQWQMNLERDTWFSWAHFPHWWIASSEMSGFSWQYGEPSWTIINHHHFAGRQ